MITSCLAPIGASAWEGHRFEDWQAINTWKPAPIATRQVGHADLVPLLAPAKDAPRGIDSIRGWETRRQLTATAIRSILGEMTAATTQSTSQQSRGAPRVEVLGEERLADHIRRHIRIQSEDDDWIPAWLLIPNHRVGRLPAMICLHQTVAQGKDEPAGIQGSAKLAFALELVRQGYVCIAPDAIGFGERIPRGTAPYHDSAHFFRRHPGWSFMGKMVWDTMRVVDVLQSLPEVDPLQIGCIGHSHGAYGTLFAAAFDTRISVAIASCGFTTFRSDPTPQRWSHLTALMPQIGTWLPRVDEIPFDWNDVCAMIAPRSLYVWYATRDSIFPRTDNLDALFHDVRSVYSLYGAAGDLAWKAWDGAHSFPEPARQDAYAWLGERLFPTGDLHQIPSAREQWQAQRPVLQRVITRSLGKLRPREAASEVKVLSTDAMPGYERRLIEYRVGPQEPVRAYLCMPEGDQKVPGMLVLHQTAKEGKLEATGQAGDPTLAFGSELAARGYVTLSPDSITAGERIDAGGPFDTRGHYQRHPDVSAMGQMLRDAQTALDVLAASSRVDPDRLGAIGHSLGAEESLILAAFDERVKAVVASCGYSTFRADPNRMCWARDSWFSYMPMLRPVFLRGDLPAWDWDDIVRLIAPRAVFQFNTLSDNIFPKSRSAYESAEQSRAIWKLYDRADQLVNVIEPGRHGIDAESKRRAYTWLDLQLRR